jgi:hypothetical protein
MQLANRQAMRFSHEYIGTEHLLLGLIEEGSGVAMAALKSLGIDPQRIRREVENLIQPGPKKDILQDAPPTPRAKRVIECSMEEARKMHCDYVGTEHILLGLLRVEEGVAAVAMMNHGVNIAAARKEIDLVLSCGRDDFREGRSHALGIAAPATRSVEAPPPTSCPRCGEAQVVRVIYEYSHLSDWQVRDIASGKAILCSISQIAAVGPPWVCRRCAPGWSDVQNLSMQDYQLQLTKEKAVHDRDFETAARQRDSQERIRHQITEVLKKLWQGT